MSIEWIRLDPENEWLCDILFEQPDFMWGAQLHKDKDVVAQSEAVKSLADMPSAGTCGLLSKAVAEPTFFYRIRMDACFAIAKVMDHHDLRLVCSRVFELYWVDPVDQIVPGFILLSYSRSTLLGHAKGQ
jgi:hypothetical protein